MTWALDLDGVIWRGDTAVPGSAGAVAALRSSGERVVFFTNNSFAGVDDFAAKLERVGISAPPEDLLTSGQAAASLLDAGTTALLCAGPGVKEALEAKGVTIVKEGPADAVVVGWHSTFDYEELTVAMTAVVGGARLIGTNEDATYPTAGGLIPGGGSLLAAVAYASSTTPEVAGKPHQPMVDLIAQRVGKVDVMVGDRANTDGLLARNMGARFALVLSGVTAESDLPVDPNPELVAADLASVVTRWAPPAG